MQVVTYILIAIYAINCLALVVLTMMQSKNDTGASGSITGSTTNNFYEKNKGRTREGKLRRWTIILGISFVILTIVLGIVYVVK